MIESGIRDFVVVLMAAAGVAAVVRRLPVPYIAALALVGSGLGFVFTAPRLHLTQGLILFVLLPGLLFEASFQINWRHLRDNLAIVVSLATVGVLLTTGLIGLMEHGLLGIAWPLALLIGAMVAPTDPVAVIGVFRQLGVSSRLANLVEAESLFNDGTGVAVFVIALGVVQGAAVSVPSAALDFIRLSLGGVALGTLIGFLLSKLTELVDDAQIEITLTGIAAYGGYLLGETVHLSGILTVVAAGVVLGNYGRVHGMSERTRAAVEVFWDYVAFLLNSIVFLLIGLDVPWSQIASHPVPVLAGIAIVLLVRGLTVYSLTNLLRPFGRHVSLRWQHVVVWSGMKGAVAVALLLSLSSADVKEIDTVRAVVYGIVLTSIVLQGFTIGPVTRRLLPTGHGHPEPA